MTVYGGQATPVLQMVQVGRTFAGPPPVDALHPSDLTVHPGDYLAIVGPSGSGKSTLLHILGLLDQPTTGTYLLSGQDTSQLPERVRSALRANYIGFVFQSFHLLPHRTAAENVALAMLYNRSPRSGRRRASETALDSVGLSHRIDALPTTMSGGERQRVAIARALVNRPALLLCDEPTGNLDTANSDSIMQHLADLHTAGYTVVVITHDPAVAARAQRVIEIRDGRLTEVTGSRIA
jgi:putative ABC transport system ATP-binding protein